MRSSHPERHATFCCAWVAPQRAGEDASDDNGATLLPRVNLDEVSHPDRRAIHLTEHPVRMLRERHSGHVASHLYGYGQVLRTPHRS